MAGYRIFIANDNLENADQIVQMVLSRAFVNSRKDNIEVLGAIVLKLIKQLEEENKND